MTRNAASVEPLWSSPIAQTPSPPPRVVLVGERKNGVFVPGSALIAETSDSQTARLDPFPLDTDLAALLEPRPFGIEERVDVKREDGEIRLRCAPGGLPAGMTLSAKNHRYPEAMRGDLVVEGRSTARFSFAVVAAGEDSIDVLTGSADAAGGPLASIPSAAWPGGARDLVVVCPPGAGEATVTSVRLAPRLDRVVSGLGTWIWDARRFLEDPAALVARARRDGVDDIYLQLRIADGRVVDAARIGRLIAVLSDAGIGMHAVEGDPDMATPAGLTNALERARIIRRFRESAAPGLMSVQYDIEPYLRPEYAADPDAGWRAWATTIGRLSDVLDDKVSVVVPFWLLEYAGAEAVLRSTNDAISGVVVMAYRTDAAELERLAEAWLSWGARSDLPVWIALENGPLASEVHRTFVRAERGNVMIESSGDGQRIAIMPEPVVGTTARPVYAFSHEVEADPGRVSFMGDHHALMAIAERLRRTLSAWDSFAGLFIHELITAPG